jgi:transposase
MEKLDGRKLDSKTMEQIRTRAVQRVQEGESPEVVIKTLGFARACIYNWLARYRSGGWHALRTGKQSGRPKRLDGQQIAWIYRTIRDKNPQQLKFVFALWTRKLVVRLIKDQFGIKLSESSVGRLLRQLGFTCQKPLYRAYQQNPKLVDEWKANVYPQIRKRAKKKKAIIYFEDESGIRSDFHSGKTWALEGQTPIIEATGARFGLNMIAAVSGHGQMKFMVVQGTVKADQICEFLNRLMNDHEGKVFLIWDGHPTHRSKKVKKYVESFEGRLEVYTLPSYSPELNPTEQVWSHVKSNNVGRKVVFGPDQLKTAVIGALRSLQRLPDKIKSLFRHPDCSYTLA